MLGSGLDGVCDKGGAMKVLVVECFGECVWTWGLALGMQEMGI